jgi:AcrR family transcriptional regulator
MPRTLSKTQVEDFRDRLIETATRLFAERGPEAFTMRQLAAELGCSAMTPYRYFKDKDEILAAVRASAFDSFAVTMESAFNQPDVPVPERSAAVGNAYVDFAFAHPEAYKLMFDLSQPDESAYPELVKATTRAKQTMTQYVRAMVEAGLLDGDPERMGVVFWAALHGAVVLQLAGKLAPEYDFETVRGDIFGALFMAFAKRPQ